jgi:hypothetical protein
MKILDNDFIRATLTVCRVQIISRKSISFLWDILFDLCRDRKSVEKSFY